MGSKVERVGFDVRKCNFVSVGGYLSFHYFPFVVGKYIIQTPELELALAQQPFHAGKDVCRPNRNFVLELDVVKTISNRVDDFEF